MKLSDLALDEVELVEESSTPNTPLRLSELKEDDIEVIESVEEAEPSFSKLSSAGLGAAQGITYGFADELEGGARSLANLSPSDYEKYRDVARERYKEAESVNPGSYMIGELAGGVAVPIPGAGLIKGTTTAAKLGKMGLSGALYGAGASEEESIGGTLTDAAIGGGFGAGMGKALPIAGELGLKIAKAAPTIATAAGGAAVGGYMGGVPGAVAGAGTGIALARGRPGELSRKAFELSKKGIDITTEAGREILMNKESKAIRNVLKALTKTNKSAGKEIGAAIKAAEEQGQQFSTEDIFKIIEDIKQLKGTDKAAVSKLEERLTQDLYDVRPTQVKIPIKEIKNIDSIKKSTGSKMKEGDVLDLPGADDLVNVRSTNPSFRVDDIVDPSTGELLSRTETQSKVLEGMLPGVPKETLTPSQVQKFKDLVYDESQSFGPNKLGDYRNATDKDVNRKLSELYKEVRGKVAGVKGYDAASNKYADTKAVLESLGGGLEKNRIVAGGKTPDKALKLMSSLESDNPVTRENVKNLKTGLETVYGNDTATKVVDRLKDTNESARLARMFTEDDNLKNLSGTRLGVLQNLIEKGEKIPISIAAKTGTLAKDFGKAAAKGSTTKLSDVAKDPKRAADVAAWATKSGYNQLANIIRTLPSKDATARAATIYLLNADPVYRQQLNESEEMEQPTLEETEE